MTKPILTTKGLDCDDDVLATISLCSDNQSLNNTHNQRQNCESDATGKIHTHSHTVTPPPSPT